MLFKGARKMGNESKSPGVIDASAEVIVLAFKLTDYEIGHLPSNLQALLDSPKVKSSIERTLLNFAKTRAQSQTTQVTSEELMKLLEDGKSNVTTAVQTAALEQVKSSAQFKQLEAALKRFEDTLDKSELGVWVDENSTVLYIVGAALLVGASTALFLTKTGGPILNMAVSPFKGNDYKIVKSGGFKLMFGVDEFTPDAQLFGAHLTGNLAVKSVKTQLKLGILVKGAEIQSAGADLSLSSGSYTLRLNGDAKSVTPDAKSVEHHVQLHLSTSLEGTFKDGKFSLGIGVVLEPKGASGDLKGTLNLGRNIDLGLSGGFTPTGAKGALSAGLKLSNALKLDGNVGLGSNGRGGVNVMTALNLNLAF
jgi:hypothetical protein